LTCLEPEYLDLLIERSNLSDDDRKIAALALKRAMPYIEIGVELGADDATREMSRSTVGLRMKKIIVPRLRELARRDIEKEARAGA
jgi:hypothetical protein